MHGQRWRRKVQHPLAFHVFRFAIDVKSGESVFRVGHQNLNHIKRRIAVVPRCRVEVPDLREGSSQPHSKVERRSYDTTQPSVHERSLIGRRGTQVVAVIVEHLLGRLGMDSNEHRLWHA